MARTYQISSISQSGGVGVPGRVTLSSSVGDVTSVFQGQFYRNSVGGTLPGYTTPAPAGYTLIQATSFNIVSNSSYNGRYTVYSPVSVSDPITSSSVSAGMTSIHVNELVGPPTTPGDDLNTGMVTDVSTYLIAISGESSLVLPPTVILSDRPIGVIGQNGTPWGETYTQNFVSLAQNFAGGAAPAAPYLGQTWYDSTNNLFNLRTASGWVAIASGVAGSNLTYRFVQNSASSSWVINHGLSLASPFVCLIQLFVLTGGGYKMMIPQDITFTDANNLTVTFTNPQTGVALIQS